MQKTNFREQFTNVADACALAQSIVDTVREPVIVLDKALRYRFEPLLLFGIRGEPCGNTGKTPLRIR